MNNAKLTPRQKMINMLYLVLTAILALNVSNEVLDAFKNVNDSISKSNRSVQQKNESTYSEFARQYAIDSAKAKVAFEQARKARGLSQKLYSLLEVYKQSMINEAGGIDEETGKIIRDDNIDISTRLFVENNGSKGKQLKKDIETTREQLLALIADEGERKKTAEGLALKLEQPKDGKAWEFATFNHVPVVAAVTTLTKYQNDVLNAENHIVESLYASVYANTEKVDRMMAMVNSPSSLVLQGEAYRADVLVAASSSSLEPEVFLGSFTPEVKKDENGGYVAIVSASDKLPLNNAVRVTTEGGLGKLNLGASSTGNKKYTGVVRVKSANGEYKFFPFDGEYQVAPKTAVVSPTMMNVMYVGLNNPLQISVPGFSQSDVTAGISSGALAKNSGGTYNATFTNPGRAKVTVKAKVNGREMVMGEQEFRVKSIPTPTATLDGVMSPTGVSVPFMKSKRGVVAKVEGFEYDVPFRVMSYVVTFRQKDGNILKKDNEGPGFNATVKSWLNNIQKGEAVFFDEIVVMGPDMKKRKVNTLAFNVVMN
jgi:gliding motility-associated protein GldM